MAAFISQIRVLKAHAPLAANPSHFVQVLRGHLCLSRLLLKHLKLILRLCRLGHQLKRVLDGFVIELAFHSVLVCLIVAQRTPMGITVMPDEEWLHFALL